MSSRELYEDPEFPARKGWKRPHEIHSEPKFIHEGVSRFDVHQGHLGNCWFVAAVATLATRPELFKRVVPEGQAFGPGYNGQFRFNFWRHGKWTKVMVDDRLPTKEEEGELTYCSNRATTEEFWPALLEKAYAKVNGSYTAMHGGHQEDALVDLTGGIGQRIELRKIKPHEFFEFLLAQNSMSTLMGCSVYKTSGMKGAKLPNGLVAGHAYSITGIKTVVTENGESQLLRIRNPWGRMEWNGAWSDKKMSAAMRQELGLTIDDDGEFWMSYEDWLKHFHKLSLCHLPPDVKLKDHREWKEIAFHGSWEKKVGNGSHGVVLSGDQSGGRAEKTKKKNTVIISLMQINDAGPSDRAHLILDLCEAKQGKLREIVRLDDPFREISHSMSLEDGTYVVRPSTREPDAKGRYLLRIYTDGCVESSK